MAVNGVDGLQLWFSLVEAAPGRCVIELPFRPGLTQHHGLFHAGVLTTLADPIVVEPPFT